MDQKFLFILSQKGKKEEVGIHALYYVWVVDFFLITFPPKKRNEKEKM